MLCQQPAASWHLTGACIKAQMTLWLMGFRSGCSLSMQCEVKPCNILVRHGGDVLEVGKQGAPRLGRDVFCEALVTSMASQSFAHTLFLASLFADALAAAADEEVVFMSLDTLFK